MWTFATQVGETENDYIATENILGPIVLIFCSLKLLQRMKFQIKRSAYVQVILVRKKEEEKKSPGFRLLLQCIKDGHSCQVLKVKPMWKRLQPALFVISTSGSYPCLQRLLFWKIWAIWQMIDSLMMMMMMKDADLAVKLSHSYKTPRWQRWKILISRLQNQTSQSSSWHLQLCSSFILSVAALNTPV